ncbi:hypothetical protein J6590_015690 [Homalodisca vitripennis]|nr:hypothetical protein J6590_015690 [Homalodisca vitripennis]
MNTMAAGGSAVVVRDAYKRYSPSAVVLRGLNLTVSDGTIYGLLGSSGCGKTTLLRSIVGLLRLDAGEIQVKAGRKNNVGYMPQDLGLYEYMSIMEVFEFYGKLYGMKHGIAEERGCELIDFLKLPESSRHIGSLSVGQQRRLSFAVALIHDPDLLILDEPTVGIDRILSASIWQRMMEMASTRNKTIIITTHYIEEARLAQTVGLMRDGVLLAEESPASLMTSQGCNSLEEAFLILSQRQEESIQTDQNRDQQYCRPRSVEKGVSIGRAPGQPNGYGLLGNKGATLLMGCDSRRSPTRNSFLPSVESHLSKFGTGSTLMQLFRPSPIGRGSTMTLTELVRPPRGARWNK